jgi:hypothetical protein
VAYLDTDSVDADNYKIYQDLVRQLSHEYANGAIPTQKKVTMVRSPKSLPEGWDVGCIPFGITTRRSIERILKDIKKDEED